jgi:hypothetical protein
LRYCIEPPNFKRPLSKVWVNKSKAAKETRVIKVIKSKKSVTYKVEGEANTLNGAKKKGLLLNVSSKLKILNIENQKVLVPYSPGLNASEFIFHISLG